MSCWDITECFYRTTISRFYLTTFPSGKAFRHSICFVFEVIQCRNRVRSCDEAKFKELQKLENFVQLQLLFRASQNAARPSISALTLPLQECEQPNR
jgi:hypothetical protein